MAEGTARSPHGAARPAEFSVERFASVGSTNTWLLDRARAGAPAGLVALADHQGAGRGRLARRWEAPAGKSLLVSVLLRPVMPPGSLFACSAAVAVAAAEACALVAGVTPGVKWPNDLLVGEEKLAGILAESDPSAPGGDPGSIAVVVGLGCNLEWDSVAGATCLAVHATRSFTRDSVAEALLGCLAVRVPLLESEDGRRALVDALRERCVTLGRAVRVERLDATTLEGTATRMEDDGRLVLSTVRGEVSVSAGDVVHLRRAPGGGE